MSRRIEILDQWNRRNIVWTVTGADYERTDQRLHFLQIALAYDVERSRLWGTVIREGTSVERTLSA